MTAARVVPALDVSEQRESRLGLRLETPSIDQFALEARKEALRHGVVVGVTDASHRWPHTELAAALTERQARVLGGFNSSSQHILMESCDEDKEATFGSGWTCEDEIARAASGAASIAATPILASDR